MDDEEMRQAIADLRERVARLEARAAEADEADAQMADAMRGVD